MNFCIVCDKTISNKVENPTCKGCGNPVCNNCYDDHTTDCVLGEIK